MLPPIFQNENQPPRNFPSGADNQVKQPAQLIPQTGAPPLQQPGQPASNFTPGVATQQPPQGLIQGMPNNAQPTPPVNGNSAPTGSLAPQHNPSSSAGQENTALTKVLSLIELLIKTGQLK